jgi:hypothetical protein
MQEEANTTSSILQINAKLNAIIVIYSGFMIIFAKIKQKHKITNYNMKANIKYIGCDDAQMNLFESQYVTQEGMCYNSYLILDDKVAVMDSVDPRKTSEWLQKGNGGGREN